MEYEEYKRLKQIVEHQSIWRFALIYVTVLGSLLAAILFIH